MTVVKKLILSVFAVILSIVWGVQATGLLGMLISSLNNYDATTKLIIGISIVVSLVGLYFVWSGRLSYKDDKTITFTKRVCDAYFLSLILLVLLYMVVVGDIKYVLLFEVVVTWVIWFFIRSCISKELERYQKKTASIETDAVTVEDSTGEEEEK